MVSRTVALFRAAHFLPSLTVTALTFALAWRTSDASTAVGIALTFFSGQLIVGWSNDLIDYSDDFLHSRNEKPLVAGLISRRFLANAIFINLIVLLTLSMVGPLNGKYGFLHLIAVLSAVSYNVKLKATTFSFLPYLISFGILPIAVLGATGFAFQLWMAAIGGLFGIGAHFANVFKDLTEDRASGILGLPQILGERSCRFGAALSFGAGAAILYSESSNKFALLILLASIGFLAPLPRKIVFPFAMALGLAVMGVFIITL